MAPSGNRPFCGSAFWRVRMPVGPGQQVAAAGLVRPIFPGAPGLDRIGAVAPVAGLDLALRQVLDSGRPAAGLASARVRCAAGRPIAARPRPNVIRKWRSYAPHREEILPLRDEQGAYLFVIEITVSPNVWRTLRWCRRENYRRCPQTRHLDAQISKALPNGRKSALQPRGRAFWQIAALTVDGSLGNPKH